MAAPHAAQAISPISPVCSAGGPLATGACPLAGAGGGLASSLTAQIALVPVEAWVVGGASFALQATSRVLGETTSPQLGSTWFSATYWRVAGISAVLTLPFLFAAALQALVRSDLGLLVRAAIGYLPLALLAVAIAAPVTMLLLAASDQLCSAVSSAAGQQGADFLAHATSLLGTIGATVSSPFVVFLVGLLTVAGAIVLWVELLVREAAVYVIVLMLPLAFAAFVWPARRAWATRAIEVLVALILSKFVIVAVLSLGGAALDHGVHQGVTGLLAGGVLMALAAFSPWALLRLIPLAELAAAAAGSMSAGSTTVGRRVQQAEAWASEAEHWISKTAQMRNAAREVPRTDAATATKQNASSNAPSTAAGASAPSGLGGGSTQDVGAATPTAQTPAAAPPEPPAFEIEDPGETRVNLSEQDSVTAESDRPPPEKAP